jgi:hypothetical protein
MYVCIYFRGGMDLLKAGVVVTVLRNIGIWHTAVYCYWMWLTDGSHCCCVVAEILMGHYGNYMVDLSDQH